MKYPKRILLLIPGFPQDESDSQCIPILQAFIAALPSDIAVSVLAFQYPHEEKHYQWRGHRVYAAGGKNRPFPLRFLTWRKLKRQAIVWHQEAPFDLIHSFWWSECAWIGQQLSQQWKRPHLCTLMGQDALPRNRYRFFLRKRVPKVVAISKFQAQCWEKHSGQSVWRVIPLGIDEPSQQGISADRPIHVLGVGSLIELKQYEQFIQIIHRLSTRIPALRACLIGDGPQRELLIRQIKQLGLETHIRLTGALPREAVLKLMQKSQVLLHPSRYESLGYVFLEALQAGMYVVSRQVGLASISSKWKVAHNLDEMEANILALRQEAMDFRPAKVPTLSDTISAYVFCYQQLISQAI